MQLGTIILLAVLVAVAVYIARIYNKLVTLKNRCLNAFAQIEVQLKRRYDLIPNLVETAKGYLTHERETLDAVVTARSQALAGLEAAKRDPTDADAVGQLGSAERGLSGALGRLNVVVEAYPDLKANRNMMQLSEELASTENRVAFARQSYNDQVMAYNTYRRSVPAVFFAETFGHGRDAALLEFEDSAEIQAAPKVSFH